MKQYRILVKGNRISVRYFAQRRFLLIFWIPIQFNGTLYGGEKSYEDAVNVIKTYKSRYKKKYYLED